jgi:hypothetical protein
VDKINGRIGIKLVVQDYEGHVIAARILTKIETLKLVAAEAFAVSMLLCLAKN